MRADLKRLKRDTEPGRAVAAGLSRHTERGGIKPSLQRWLVAAGLVVIVAAAGTYLYLRQHQSHHLTEQDTVVLADFTNQTGEPVFDDTLKQGLRVQLEQSPFLNVLPDEKAAQELAYMGRQRETRLTREVAREVCLRTGSKAMLEGSIASLGTHYVLGLNAVNCQTGDLLASDQVEAEAREGVIAALGSAATKMRGKLGESLASIQKYDAPVEQVTTSSLEALQAYSLGLKTWDAKGIDDAVPFFQRATQLDPNFAMAYFHLAFVYYMHGRVARGNEAMKKAYELRGQVSEREKFIIDINYYNDVTGELAKEISTCEVWRQTYPRDPGPYGCLAFTYSMVGRDEESLENFLDVLRLKPNPGYDYLRTASAYLRLERPDEAKEMLMQAEAHKLSVPRLRLAFYELAFLRGDAGEMARQVEAVGQTGGDDTMVSAEAETEAYRGRLAKAREFSWRAADMARQNGNREAAADFEAVAALREAEFGNVEQAKRLAAAALTVGGNPEGQNEAALALGRAGDSGRALATADELNRQHPLDTMINGYWLPTIRAAAEIGRANPSRAIELLQPTTVNELVTQFYPSAPLCPIYVRGQAYLALRQGKEAAAEFQKILNHPSLMKNCPLGSLAHLGLGRAYALEAGAGSTTARAARNHWSTTGDTPTNRGGLPAPQADALAKARAAYQDFFNLWKDADPDIPILKQAKAEYAKLQ